MGVSAALMYLPGCDSVLKLRIIAKDNYSCADIKYNSTTSSVILRLYNSSTGFI